MSSSQLQVIRKGLETWEVTRTTPLWKDAGTWEYEIIGRVIRADGLYYVELPRWEDNGYKWDRCDRAYQIPRGALRALCDGKASLHKARA